MNARNLLVLLGSLLVMASASAQDEDGFNLFEATETQQTPQQNTEATRVVSQPRNTEPAFTLKGTARFGDVYTASLVARDGSAVQVNWRPSQRAPVANHAGFNVIDVKSRTVSLELPSSEACVPAQTRGVNCSTDGRISILTLATATPLPPRQPEPVQPQGGQVFNEALPRGNREAVEFVEGQPVEALPLNPFSGEPQAPVRISEEERQARAARQQARMRALQNFEPVRIPDDQVPPGMRKVETPFGDRLVPDDGR